MSSDFIGILIFNFPPFIAVLVISYFIGLIVSHYISSYFQSQKYFVLFSFGNYLVIETLLSLAMTMDLIISFPYRPLEFIGQPFLFSNIILLLFAFIFAKNQQNKVTEVDTSEKPLLPEKTITVVIIIIALGLLIFTRWNKLEQEYDRALFIYAVNLNHPEICSHLSYFGSLDRNQISCLKAALDTKSISSIDRCELITRDVPESDECIINRAIRNKQPNDCLVFIDTSLHSKNSSYKAFECMSNFVDTKEWSKLCDSAETDYPDKPHYFSRAQCDIHEKEKEAEIAEIIKTGSLLFNFPNLQPTQGRTINYIHDARSACSNTSTNDSFHLNFGDGNSIEVGCKGNGEYTYTSNGNYQMRLYKNEDVISERTVSIYGIK